MELVSLLLNLILGGGLISSLVTLRSTKKKASYEAKASELDNVQEAITIWREMAENLRRELMASHNSYDEMAKQVESLRRAVTRLTTVNTKMVKLLDKITPDNLETMVEQIKLIHNEN